jgi:hypothetical protein
MKHGMTEQLKASASKALFLMTPRPGFSAQGFWDCGLKMAGKKVRTQKSMVKDWEIKVMVQFWKVADAIARCVFQEIMDPKVFLSSQEFDDMTPWKPSLFFVEVRNKLLFILSSWLEKGIQKLRRFRKVKLALHSRVLDQLKKILVTPGPLRDKLLDKYVGTMSCYTAFGEYFIQLLWNDDDRCNRVLEAVFNTMIDGFAELCADH